MLQHHRASHRGVAWWRQTQGDEDANKSRGKVHIQGQGRYEGESEGEVEGEGEGEEESEGESESVSKVEMAWPLSINGVVNKLSSIHHRP